MPRVDIINLLHFLFSSLLRLRVPECRSYLCITSSSSDDCHFHHKIFIHQKERATHTSQGPHATGMALALALALAQAQAQDLRGRWESTNIIYARNQFVMLSFSTKEQSMFSTLTSGFPKDYQVDNRPRPRDQKNLIHQRALRKKMDSLIRCKNPIAE